MIGETIKAKDRRNSDVGVRGVVLDKVEAHEDQWRVPCVSTHYLIDIGNGKTELIRAADIIKVL